MVQDPVISALNVLVDKDCITQQQIAYAVGVSQATVSRWLSNPRGERGSSPTTFDVGRLLDSLPDDARRQFIACMCRRFPVTLIWEDQMCPQLRAPIECTFEAIKMLSDIAVMQSRGEDPYSILASADEALHRVARMMQCMREQIMSDAASTDESLNLA